MPIAIGTTTQPKKAQIPNPSTKYQTSSASSAAFAGTQPKNPKSTLLAVVEPSALLLSTRNGQTTSHPQKIRNQHPLIQSLNADRYRHDHSTIALPNTSNT